VAHLDNYAPNRVDERRANQTPRLGQGGPGFDSGVENWLLGPTWRMYAFLFRISFSPFFVTTSNHTIRATFNASHPTKPPPNYRSTSSNIPYQPARFNVAPPEIERKALHGVQQRACAHRYRHACGCHWFRGGGRSGADDFGSLAVYATGYQPALEDGVGAAVLAGVDVG
jgi:hypothetical protein